MNNKNVRYLLLLILITFIASCADSITDSTPSEDGNNNQIKVSTFSEIQTNAFNKTCAASGCHNSGGVSPDLSGNSYSNIVNKSSSTGMLYIKPKDPNNSYLLLKIIGDTNINGQQMPRNSAPLSQATIDAIRKWIEEGAQNN